MTLKSHLTYPPATIFVVDDDLRVLKSLRHLLQASGYAVQASASAAHFLRHYDPELPGCVVCDVAMPGFGGVALQRALKARGCRRPLIFLTGHGSIPASVQAIKDGAEHYLTKPVSDTDLLRAVGAAVARDAEIRGVRRRLTDLTAREREVLTRVAEGQLSKQIAGDFGVAERTIKFHRANLMRKIGITSIARLVQLATEAGLIGKSQGRLLGKPRGVGRPRKLPPTERDST